MSTGPCNYSPDDTEAWQAPECTADEGHPCDANDGEPCERCARYLAAAMADALRSYHPQYAKPADYREQMIDAGRGHLLRDDE